MSPTDDVLGSEVWCVGVCVIMPALDVECSHEFYPMLSSDVTTLSPNIQLQQAACGAPNCFLPEHLRGSHRNM